MTHNQAPNWAAGGGTPAHQDGKGSAPVAGFPREQWLDPVQRNADSRLFHRVFIVAPLAFITGLLQAPAIARDERRAAFSSRFARTPPPTAPIAL